MLQTTNGGRSKNPSSSASSSTLFALKPRQVLLAEQSCRAAAAAGMAKNQNQTVTLTPDQTTNLIHSVLGFVERNGFSKTLKRLLSEAQIQDDNWKKNSVALENIYSKYLRTCSSVDKKCGTKDEEPMDVITKQGQECSSATSKETANKKKKKKHDIGDQNAVMGQSGTTEKITNSSTDSEKKFADDIANESNVVVREKKKSKKLSASVGRTEQNSEASNEASGRNACELQEGSTKRHKEKNKKSHLTSESVDVTIEQKKLDLLPEVTLDRPEDLVSSKGDDKVDLEAKSRTNDKKKKSKVVDSEVENGGQQPLENKKGVLTEKLVNDEKPLKVKKRKKQAAATDGVKGGVEEKHTEENTDETDYKEEIMQQSSNMADDKKGGSKKRKRSTNEGNEDQLNEKVASEESKRRKTEGSDEAKSLERQTIGKTENGQFSYNEPPKASVKQPNEKANNNIGKNGGEESALQNSAKSKLNGSAEPKTVNAFQRVKAENVVFLDERLQDNSYWAKDGAEVGYGAKAQEVLGQVRGRGFRHEKTKKKRGSYRGGQIDLQSHSIKFNYSDEE